MEIQVSPQLPTSAMTPSGPDRESSSAETSVRAKLNSLYEFYFSLFRSFGIFPFEFNRRTLVVTRLRTPLQILYTRFNIYFLFIYFLTEGALLAYNQATKYKYDTIKNGYLLQGLWFTGSIVVGSIMRSFLGKKEEMAQLLTTSCKLEQFVFKDNPEARQGRTASFRRQLVLYVVAILSSPVGLIPINIFFPRFPSFLNSVFMLPDSTGRTLLDPFLPDNPRLLCTLNILIRAVFHLREVYFPLLAWACFGNCDILLNALFASLSIGIDQAHRECFVEGATQASRYSALNLYSGLRPQLVRIDSHLGLLIFSQEMLNLIMNALVVYAALVFENPILVAFFGFNVFTVTARMYIFYLPIARVLQKSDDFIKAMNAQVSTHRDKLVKAKMRTLRRLFMRPLGVHRITPNSIMDYILAVLSYMVVARKT